MAAVWRASAAPQYCCRARPRSIHCGPIVATRPRGDETCSTGAPRRHRGVAASDRWQAPSHGPAAVRRADRDGRRADPLPHLPQPLPPVRRRVSPRSACSAPRAPLRPHPRSRPDGRLCQVPRSLVSVPRGRLDASPRALRAGAYPLRLGSRRCRAAGARGSDAAANRAAASVARPSIKFAASYVLASVCVCACGRVCVRRRWGWRGAAPLRGASRVWQDSAHVALLCICLDRCGAGAARARDCLAVG